MSLPTFDDIFKFATSVTPYPYQRALATADRFPDLLNIPTGLGKTAAVVLAWLWRRRFAGEEVKAQTPRRLIYCLPMRTLVEQTATAAREFIEGLGLSDEIKVHLLMGGEDPSDWDETPDRETILIGTQDMLLSRALNRGYGMSQYRWPMHFALLNNDALWVMDETQLMGVGLTTTAQLQGLRAKLKTYGVTHSLWMSATLDTSPINTVDHPEPTEGYVRLGLSAADFDSTDSELIKQLGAIKPLERSSLVLTSESEKKNYAKELAASVLSEHQAGTLTLVILNRVSRTQTVYGELKKLLQKSGKIVDLAIVHARFRPCDREAQQQRLFSEEMPEAGRIVIASPAIEAGVDVSAATMFTELAPWPSLVQRFGRCNRTGNTSNPRVLWIDVVSKDGKDSVCLPYEMPEIDRSRAYLQSLKDVGRESLEQISDVRPLAVVHTLRRKDLLDLWDTTPDLAGNDLDISRFIRESDDTDLQLFWREYPETGPSPLAPAAQREELCSVPVWHAQEFLTKLKKQNHYAFRWNPLEKEWREVKESVRPGMILLLKPTMGGYDNNLGWTGDVKDIPTPYVSSPLATPNTANDDEPDTKSSHWISLSDHLNDVTEAIECMRKSLSELGKSIPWDSLSTAARWHDVGKAHPAWVNMLLRGREDEERLRETYWAKSDKLSLGKPKYWIDGTDGEEQQHRIGFRHELASALAWLAHHNRESESDLVAFLIAAHHGKVRASIRSMPNEKAPKSGNRKFARGVWDGDEVPVVLESGELVVTRLDLSLMEMGENAMGPSWLARVLKLRDEYGPFQLSFLETLLRVADWQGSKAGEARDED